MQQVEHLAIAADTNRPDRRSYFISKRILDLILSLVVLLITAPLMLIITLLIRLDSPGPILFRQTRVGRGGRPFTCYKFRTMFHNVDHEVHRQYVQSLIRNGSTPPADTSPSSSPIYKLTQDKRVTCLGRFLRRTSLDELPQVFNVLAGDMSWVGPRPPLPYEVNEYEDWHKGRLATLPGITGWWQVWGRSRVPFDEMVRMDLEYIARQSLWLDLKIIILTIPAVLFGHGAQ